MFFLQSNMSYCIQNMESCVRRKKKRKHLGLAVNNLTFIHDAVLPTHTSPCHRRILPSNGLVRCTSSRPACCVYLHGALWYHLSDTQPESGTAEAAFTSSLFDLFVAFHSAKNDSLAILLSRKI